MNEKYFFNQEI